MYWKHAESQLKKEYNKVVKQIDEALLFFKQDYPDAELLYFKILPRCWWGYYARKLARFLDYYLCCTLKCKYAIKEIWARRCFSSHYQFDEIVDFGMLTCDMTHLNVNGNKAVIEAMMRPILHKWKWAK